MKSYVNGGFVYVVAKDGHYFTACSINTMRSCAAFMKAFDSVVAHSKVCAR